MKIVVALPYAPWPVARGIDRLVMNLIEGLSARHEVVLVTMALGRNDLERLAEIETPRVSVRAVVAPHRRSAFHRAAHKARNAAAMLFARTPMQVSYAAPPELLRLIAGVARGERADLVLAAYWHLYRLPEYLPDARLALVTMDLDFLVHPGRIERAHSGANRARETIRTRLLERIELAAYERFDTILTVTEEDAAVLRERAGTSGKTILPLPLALDLSRFSSGSFARERDVVLFPGAFDADFNRDALHYLLGDIWPLVRERNPGASLEIVGRGIDERSRAMAGSWSNGRWSRPASAGTRPCGPGRTGRRSSGSTPPCSRRSGGRGGCAAPSTSATSSTSLAQSQGRNGETPSTCWIILSAKQRK